MRRIDIMRIMLMLVTLFAGHRCLAASDDKTKVVRGSYSFVAPESMTPAQAKQRAFELLQRRLIEDEFGATVNSYAAVREGDEGTDYFSLGEIESKGEWLETIGEPQYELSISNGMVCYTVTAAGIVRPIETAEVDFVAKTLCNGATDAYETSHFKVRDKLFLSFRSPVSGYVAVYLFDGKGDVSCLLPYKWQEDGKVAVRAGRRYVFFKKDKSSVGKKNDEYIMTANTGPEVDYLYVIFSPNAFWKALDEERSKDLPRMLSFGDFQKWLKKARMKDPEMRVETKIIHIEEP